MENIELIEEKFEIEFGFASAVADFKLMSEIVKWCDSYVRNSILIFEMLRNFTDFHLFLERDKELPEYIRRIKVYIRKVKDRKMDDDNIAVFKDFILTKFKKAKPIIQDWTEQDNANNGGSFFSSQP